MRKERPGSCQLVTEGTPWLESGATEAVAIQVKATDQCQSRLSPLVDSWRPCEVGCNQTFGGTSGGRPERRRVDD